ncbi:MAG: hypothetical protein ABWY58_12990 [Aeromicrobium sp.]
MQLIDRSTVRLTFGDDLFMRRHRGLGSPVVNQFVWRFDDDVPAEALVRMRDSLARGALARRAHRSLVPAARARWSCAAEAPEIVRRAEALDPHEVLGWLRWLGTTRLDPSRGDSWRLAVADLSDGGSIVSLLADHAAADGGAMVDAVERAASGRAPLRVPPRSRLATTVVADVHDAASQLTSVGRWAAGHIRPPSARPAADSAARPATRTADSNQRAVRVPSDGWTPPLVVVECSTAQIATAAARHGGSPNVWFVAVSASLAATAGTVAAGRPVRVALPVSARTPDDLRSNATRIAQVDVAGDDLTTRDLGRIRALCKQAYAGLGAATPPADGTHDGSLLTLVQMMPTAIVRRLPQPPAATVLASNLGAVSEAFCSPTGPDGPRAHSIAAIAGQRHVDEAELDALGGGLMAWACTSGERTTLTVTALDPAHVPDDTTLLDMTTSVLSAWDIEARPW